MRKFETHDEGRIAQYVWKSPVMQAIALRIIEKAVAETFFWPDEIDFSDIAKADKNCIGSTFRSLRGLHLIEQTGEYRPSTVHDANARVIFQYRIGDPNMARALVRRIRDQAGQSTAPKPPGLQTQSEFCL